MRLVKLHNLQTWLDGAILVTPLMALHMKDPCVPTRDPIVEICQDLAVKY